MTLIEPNASKAKILLHVLVIWPLLLACALIPPLWPVLGTALFFKVHNHRQRTDARQRVADQSRVQRDLQWREWEQDPAMGLTR